MEDDDKRAANKPDADEAAPRSGHPVEPQGAIPIAPQPPIQSIPVAQGQIENPEGHQANGQTAPSEENKKRIDSSAVWMIVLTAIIAVATGLNVWIFYRESESTGKQIDKLSKKAGGIVDSMNHALLDNQTAIENAFAANEAAVDAANTQNQKSVGATLKAAKDSLTLAQRSLEVQERAWVGEYGFEITEDIVAGKAPGVISAVQNSGRSPAIHVAVMSRLYFFCGAFPNHPDYRIRGSISRTILMPNSPPIQTTESKFESPLTANFLDAIKPNGSMNTCNIYAFGKISYDDLFGKSHWRHTCAKWQKDTLRKFTVCDVYNDGDEDYPDGKEPN